MLVTVESRYYDITLLMILIVSLCMQVYDRLQRVNVTMSHKSSVRCVQHSQCRRADSWNQERQEGIKDDQQAEKEIGETENE